LYTEALLKVGQAKAAMQVLQQQLRSNQATPELYRTLAIAAKKAGFLSEAYEAFADYYYTYGDLRTAIKHLEQALDQPEIDEYRSLKIQARIKTLKQQVINDSSLSRQIDKNFDKLI
jgi:predicted Zn-dependent protease